MSQAVSVTDGRGSARAHAIYTYTVRVCGVTVDVDAPPSRGGAAAGPQSAVRTRDPAGSCEYMAHDSLKMYVCVLYCSPCAPLMPPWLGELEGTSLAIA